MYTIFDFNAVTKHSYFGQKGRTTDTMLCPTTGEEVVHWQAAVNDFLVRYMADVDNPRRLLVAHDMGTAYRTAFHPEYKNKPTSSEQSPLEKEQITKTRTWIKSFLAALGATQIGVEGVEADDVIAWICQGQGISAFIHTVDADMLQLVGPNTAVSLKGEVYTEGMEYKDIPLHLTSFSKAFLGDTSDNYKGIPGIGPAKFMAIAGAVGWDGLEKLQSIVEERNLEDAQAFAAQYPDCKPLQTSIENWGTLLSQYRLARLHPELCWKPRGGKLTRPIIHKRVPHPQKVYDLLKEVGADDLYESRYKFMLPGVMLVSAENFETVLPAIKEQMLKGDIVAYDFESSDKNPLQRFNRASSRGTFVDNLSQELTGSSFCFGEYLQNVIYVTVDHKDSPNLPKESVKDLLIYMAQNANKVRPVAHNAFFEGTVTQRQLGIAFGGVHDTRVMQRYFDENSSAGLKDMSAQYLNYTQDSYEETLKAAEAQNRERFNIAEGEPTPDHLAVRTMADITWEQAIKYGADDSLVTAHLCDLMKLLLQLDQQWDFYQKWAVEPTQTLQSAYLKGVNINWALQKRLHKQDEETIATSMEKLRELLKANVTGEETAGFESLIQEERRYMERSLRERYGDEWRKHFNNWVARKREACLYIPYEETLIMPTFSFTPTQLNKVTEILELPPIEKVTLKCLGEYFDDLNLTSISPTKYEGNQGKFLDLLQKAVMHRVDKLAKEPEIARQKAFDDLAAFCHDITKAEPKVVKAGDELNLGSPSQMQELLYCKIGVPVRLFGTSLGINRLKHGIKQAAPSTDEKAIQTAIANDAEGWQVEALKLLLAAKSANTRINLFHAKMPLWVHEDGRIHPFIMDAGTDTRRPTGSAPNILQIPSKGTGREMRSMYVPPSKDYVCVAIDFSGQELRILACESQDPKMIEAYTPGSEKDIHSMTAVGVVQRLLAKGMTEYADIADFDNFEVARKNDDHPLHALADGVRGEKAKGCIAEGSLVLTDKGLVAIEDVTLNHKVWDGDAFVTHEGVIYKGVQKVITYGTLTATPDHKVYLNDGTSKEFEEIASQQDWNAVMVGEVAGAAIGESDRLKCAKGGAQSDGLNSMCGLLRREVERCVKHDIRENCTMSMPPHQVEDQGSASSCTEILCTTAKMRESEEQVLQELRGAGHSEQVSECGELCEMDGGEFTSQRLQRTGIGQNQQRRSLRAGELETGSKSAELGEQKNQCELHHSGSTGSEVPCMGCIEVSTSGDDYQQKDSNQIVNGGEESERASSASQNNTRWSPVYDIVNAGPKHRFTVSGVVVSNCNFGMTYGAAAPTLSRNLIIPLDEADDLLEGAFSLYGRIRPWQRETAEFMTKNGFTLTAFGTKRHATDDLFSKDKGKVSRMHRQGTNATIQGTAAESLRMILTRLHTEQWLYRLKMEFFAPIYDEVVAWVHKDDVEEYCAVMKQIMTESTPPTHQIPQVPEFSIGADWGRCHELGAHPTPEQIAAAVERALAEGEEMWATDLTLSYEDVYGCTPEEFGL